MIDLIRAMFGAALKTNDSLFFAVLTGCLRVSKESIFTGLNNMTVHSIADANFDEYFGFTDHEVREMLEYYGLESHLNETREWYDGYRFGNQDVYCPWDVINYCYALRASESAQPKAYWINTSGNDMVRKLIGKAADGTTQMEIERLIAGETIVKTLNENLTHNEVDANVENIWSLLYMTGYLTGTFDPSSNRYKLKLNHGDLKATQGDTGHAEIDMLTKVYAHILDSDRKITAQRFEEAFYQSQDLPEQKDNSPSSPDIAALIAQIQQYPELGKILSNVLAKQTSTDENTENGNGNLSGSE